MKLSDYVAKFIKKEVADSVFLLSGGGIMHLVDSVANSKLIVICCHHEQGAVIAAEGYGRIKNSPGVAIVTTGPGGTNAITGIAGAWLDSVPMLVIAGQVKRDNITPRVGGVPMVRQVGFQELNLVDIVKPITKYAVTVENENDIRYHLEKALYLAAHGRPGPVFVEIPLDVQAEEIEPENLKSFDSSELNEPKLVLDEKIMEQVAKLLREAKKPLLMAGYGIRLAGGENVLHEVLEKFHINAITPIFTAGDLIPNNYKYYLGRQGMPGNKSANYAVDNCDLLLVVGERLQLTQTSYDYNKFALQAKKIMVDIDENELNKKTVNIDMPVHCDAKVFLEELLKYDIELNRWDVKNQNVSAADYPSDDKYLNVYKFWDEMNRYDKKFDITTTNGMASVATNQAADLSNGQRLLTNAGLGHMGSGLPLAVGACIARDKKPIICSEGDGSIMLNIQELQTVLYHRLPLKIFIYNNNGYYSIRNTHRKFFNRLSASDPSSGVTLPDYLKLIPAWGLKFERINNDSELNKVKKVLDYDGPIVCELMIDPNQLLLGRWSAGTLTEK